MTTTVDKTMMSGDTKIMPFNAVDNNGDAVTVTGGTATYAIAESNATAALVTKTSAEGAIVLSGTTVTITLAPADTAGLAGDYYHELQVIDAGGAVLTGFAGTISIDRDVIA